jgi:protein-tyrosine phosphatase
MVLAILFTFLPFIVLLASILVVSFIIAMIWQAKARPFQHEEPFLVKRSEAVTVDRDEQGHLNIRWDGMISPSLIYASTSPDATSNPVLIAKINGQTSVQVTGLDPRRRPYFRIQLQNGASFIVAERFLPLKSTLNFRDIGGYETADGKRVKWGQVYRAANMTRVTESDQRYLANLGIQLICDVRTPFEVKRRRDILPPGVRYLNCPVYEKEPVKFWMLLFQRRRLRQVLFNLYITWIIDFAASAHGEILKQLSNPDNLPAIVHCTAGKDRTGMAMALLLCALGVPDEKVVEDYSLSNLVAPLYIKSTQSKVNKVRWLGFKIEQLYPLIATPPYMMRNMLAYIHQAYGSVEEYLLNAAGLEKHHLSLLRENFLE